MEICILSGLVIGWWSKFWAAHPYPTQSWVPPRNPKVLITLKWRASKHGLCIYILLVGTFNGSTVNVSTCPNRDLKKQIKKQQKRKTNKKKNPNIFMYLNFVSLLCQNNIFLGPTLVSHSGVATEGARGGRVPPLTAKNLPKIWKKRGKSGKKRKNREGKAKIGKVISLCPFWQIGLAMLLVSHLVYCPASSCLTLGYSHIETYRDVPL